MRTYVKLTTTEKELAIAAVEFSSKVVRVRTKASG